MPTIGSFSASSSSVPKYQQQEIAKQDSEDSMTRYLLDLQSGKIIKENIAHEATEETREFAFGVEFVSSEDGKSYAIVDKENEPVTEFCFDGCGEWSEGLAAASVKGRWGYINPCGDFVIAPEFKTANPFQNGIAAVQDAKSEKCGYINNQGESLFGFYDYLGSFSDGLVYAKNKNTKSFKFFNEKGEAALVMKKPLTMSSDDEINAFHDFALQEFGESNDYNQLNDMGIKMIDDCFYERENLEFCKFYDGLCQFIDTSGDCPKIGFYDKSGNIAIPAEFDFVTRFHDGIALYSNGENIFNCTSGILTVDGEKIDIGDLYWIGYSFSKEPGLLKIRANKRGGMPNANGKYGFVNKTGKIVIPPQYDRIYRRYDGVFEYHDGFKTGLINAKGEHIIPAKDGDIKIYWEFGRMDDTDGPCYALVDFETYKRAYKSTDKVFRISCGEGMYLYFFEQNVKQAKKHDHDFGLMNSDGEILTGVRFMHIGEYQEGLIRGQVGWGYDYIDRDGNPVLIDFTDNCTDFFDNIAFIVSHAWVTGGVLDVMLPDFFTPDGGLRWGQRDLPLSEPLDDGRQKFFINKEGDILELTLAEQSEFLRKYYKWRNRKRPKRSVEEVNPCEVTK